MLDELIIITRGPKRDGAVDGHCRASEKVSEFQAHPTLLMLEKKTHHNSWREATSIDVKAKYQHGRPALPKEEQVPDVAGALRGVAWLPQVHSPD